MAFAILTEDQILLLTDEQRIQYEKQLEYYQKRSQFVEQIEKYESIHLEPYQLKRKPIAVQSASEVQSVQMKPYIVQPQQKVSVPVMPDLPSSISEHKIAVLPAIAAVSVDVSSPKFEKNQPTVPNIAQPTVNNFHRIMPMIGKVNLPEMQSGIPTPNVAFSPTVAANVVLPTFAQKAFDLALPKKAFDSSHFSLHTIPGIAVPETKWQSFNTKTPEMEGIPKASINKLQFPSVPISAPSKPVLPQLAVAPNAAHAYTHPNMDGVTLPKIAVQPLQASYNRLQFPSVPISAPSKPVLPQLAVAPNAAHAYMPPAMDCVILPKIAVQPLQASYSKPALHPPVLPTRAQAVLSVQPISMKPYLMAALPPKKETALPRNHYKPIPAVQSKLPQIKIPAQFERSESIPQPHSANLPKLQTPFINTNPKSIPAVSICINAPSVGAPNLKPVNMPSVKVSQPPKLVNVDSAALYQQILEMQPKRMQEEK